MALETVTHISDLVVTNPTSTDPKSEGDNHLRNIKTALKTDFPNISGVVTKTHTQLNNTLDKTGDTMTGPLAQALGTAALPSYTFSGDTNTGMWSPGADILAWSTAGAERLRIDASGNVGVGTAAPLSFARQTIQFDAGAVTSALALVSYGGAPTISFRQASGTSGAPGASNTSIINFIGASTNDGTTFLNTVAIQGNMEATATAGSHPTNITFSTTPSGSTSRIERVRIDSTGNVLVTGSGGLGYGTGSGGTVTQATSRTTGVTINKPSGQITLVSAAGTTTWQSFTVTNSAVSATDTPIVVQVSGTDLYEIHVTAVGAGNFRISYRTTGGTTTEQPVFKFEIHKGATS